MCVHFLLRCVLHVCVCAHGVCVCNAQTVPLLTERLREWQFSDTPTFSLTCEDELLPPTMSAFLQQLKALHCPSVTLQLNPSYGEEHEWLAAHELAQTVTACAPLYPHVSLEISIGCLTDGLWRLFGQMGSQVRRLMLDRVGVLSGEWVGGSWPCERLDGIGCMSSDELIRLPCPSGMAVAPVVTCHVDLDTQVSKLHLSY